MDLACRPLTPDRWDDLERLFGPERGACAGCWCMWFKLPRPEWDAAGRAGRKAMFKALVEAGPPPGVLGYAGPVPVGWCAVEPREAYPKILRSRARAPVDDRPAFAITCFYVAPRWRRKGLMRPLIRGAFDLARAKARPWSRPIRSTRPRASARAAGSPELPRRSATRGSSRSRAVPRHGQSCAGSFRYPSPVPRRLLLVGRPR